MIPFACHGQSHREEGIVDLNTSLDPAKQLTPYHQIEKGKREKKLSYLRITRSGVDARILTSHSPIFHCVAGQVTDATTNST